MGENLKIVLIDDNKDLLFTLETFLQRNGFEVHTAEDGPTGMDLIKKERPDVILLDIMMETLFSGFEVCRLVRSNNEFKHLPIIGISAMANEIGVKYNQNTDEEYFSPDEFLDKPVDKELLLKSINKLLQL